MSNYTEFRGGGYWDGSFYSLDGGDLECSSTILGRVVGAHTYEYDRWTAFYYTQVGTRPKGKCEIISAYASLHASEDQSGTNCNAEIVFTHDYGINFGDGLCHATEVISKEQTSSVAWNNIPAFTSGNWYNTPDLTSILQECVDLGGYSQDGDPLIIIKENGSDDNAYREIDEIRLYVTWITHPRVGQIFTQVEVVPPKRITGTAGLGDSVSAYKEMPEAITDQAGLGDTWTSFHYTNYQTAIDNPHAGPIRVVKIELTGKTLYLCDRIWGEN